MKDNKNQDQVARALRDKRLRDKDYREKALKMFPWICTRCGREFTGKKVRELTVHHKDLNHENNPPDGSNWELLCIYCHDNEHEDEVEYQDASTPKAKASTTYNPFLDLDKKLKDKSKK